MTAEIEVKDLPEDEEALWPVPQLPGLNVLQSETERVKRKFPKGLFESVYRNREFEAEFMKVATETNAHELRRQNRDDENREAAVARATRGVLRAAADAEVQSKRKAGARQPVTAQPSTPTKA
jgi:hypothetical protein